MLIEPTRLALLTEDPRGIGQAIALGVAGCGHLVAVRYHSRRDSVGRNRTWCTSLCPATRAHTDGAQITRARLDSRAGPLARRVPGRRRSRATQPVTAFNTGADTSRLAR